MNDELINQFIQNQLKLIDLQTKELDELKTVNSNLDSLKKSIEVTPEQKKELDKRDSDLQKQTEKRFTDLKELISSLDNKKEIATLDTDIQSLNSNVTTCFDTVHEGFSTLKFNTQYNNNLSYFFIVCIGLVFLIFVFYKFLKKFI